MLELPSKSLEQVNTQVQTIEKQRIEAFSDLKSQLTDMVISQKSSAVGAFEWHVLVSTRCFQELDPNPHPLISQVKLKHL